MTTAVVVATVVKTNLSEASFLNHTLEQIRSNDRNLLAKIADQDEEANVVTAILNVDEFMSYLKDRFSTVDLAAAEALSRESAAAEAVQTAEKPKTTVVTDSMDEFEFMNHLVDQLESGAKQQTVHLSQEDLQTMEDEPIGDEFSQRPFLY